MEGNDFHGPHDADGGATGSKLGASDVVIRNNAIHDLGSSTKTSVFSLGGTGTPHAGDFEAYRIHVMANRIWNVQRVDGSSQALTDDNALCMGWRGM